MTCSNDTCNITFYANKSSKADCSNLGLCSFPIFPDNVTEIVFRNNLLTNITKHTTLPWGLRRLDISHCILQQVDRGFIRQFPSLEYLDISYNRELSLEVLPNITEDLQYTNIKVFKFNAIQCEFGDLLTLRLSHISGIKNTSLEHIEFNSNRIYKAEQFVFSSAPATLKYVSAANNHFIVDYYLLELTYVNVEFADMSKLHKTTSAYLEMLNTSTCDDRRSTIESTKVISVPSIKDTTPIQIERSCLEDVFNVTAFKPRFIYFYWCLSTSFKTLILSDSFLGVDTIAYSLFLYYDVRSVEHIDMGGNLCKKLYYEIYSKNCTYIDFSWNYLTYIDPGYLSRANLTHLNLTGNFLGGQIDNESSIELLKDHPYLKELSLAHNSIRYIPWKFFDYLIRLQYLDLSHNRIQTIAFNIKNLKGLRMLNLSYNNLPTLPNNVLLHLDTTVENQISLDLTGNTLMCSCDTLNFLRWIHHQNQVKTILFVNFESYHCEFSNSSRVNFQHFSELLLRLESQCSSYISIIILSAVATTAFITIIVGGVLFRYRWKIRYIYYMTKRAFKRNVSMENNRKNRPYQYDAFVSYANEDRHFALKMKSEMEDKLNMTLCFHDRDFVPGVDIAENIVSAIHDSCVILCVISDNFLNSHWCLYEFNIALIERIHARPEDDETLLLVLLDDFEHSKTPLTMLEFIRTNTYLDFPNDSSNEEAFWLKLANCLK